MFNELNVFKVTAFYFGAGYVYDIIEAFSGSEACEIFEKRHVKQGQPAYLHAEIN